MADPKVLAIARGSLDGDVTAETPRGITNVRVVVIPAARAVMIRVARTYLQSFAGFLLGAAVLPAQLDPLAPPEAWQRIVYAAGLALFPSFVALVQNAAEVLARWDVTNPERRG